MSELPHDQRKIRKDLGRGERIFFDCIEEESTCEVGCSFLEVAKNSMLNLSSYVYEVFFAENGVFKSQKWEMQFRFLSEIALWSNISGMMLAFSSHDLILLLMRLYVARV